MKRADRKSLNDEYNKVMSVFAGDDTRNNSMMMRCPREERAQKANN